MYKFDKQADLTLLRRAIGKDLINPTNIRASVGYEIATAVYNTSLRY